MRRRALVFLFALSCYPSSFPPGLYQCSPEGACPEGQECNGGLCVLPGTDLSGVPPPDFGPVCVASLGGVGLRDFAIRFALKTTQRVSTALVRQRIACDDKQDFWDVRMTPEGDLSVEVNQAGGPYTSFQSTVALNDGRVHVLRIARQAQLLLSSTDGRTSGGAAASASLGALPPLAVGTLDPCADNGAPLMGTLSDLCLTVGP